MRQDLTDIVVVLDRSGSMESIKADTQGGFDNFVAEQRKAPGECLMTLTQFDTIFETVYAGKNVKDVPKLELMPRGGTALLDAIGKTINETGQRLAKMNESDRPGKVIMLIITDGGENSSHEFKHDAVMKMIKHQQEEYKWTFVYLGANQDAIQVGTSLGFLAKNSMSYAANSHGTQSAYRSLSSNVLRTRAGVGSGDFTAEDRTEQEKAGALSH